MSIFLPHSARSASASKAYGIVPLKTVLKMVGWRRRSIFATFYHKQVLNQEESGAAGLQ